MAEMLWKPSEERIKKTNMYRFMQYINDRHGTDFTEYTPMYNWSIEKIPDFWASFFDFAEIKCSKRPDRIIDDVTKMPGAEWFSGAELNFAENLLRYRDDQTALIFKGEGQPIRKLTYAELYDEVARVAASLREAGIKPGDRVVGFMPNMPEAIIAMLAAVSCGATWSSCSPDFGIMGVLDRFGQIKPRIIFTADGYFFKGKRFDSLDRIFDILKQLPSIEKVVVVPYTEAKPDIKGVPNAVHYDEFKAAGAASGVVGGAPGAATGDSTSAAGDKAPELQFEQLPFSHPLYIMYSSGTTGLPKCMVQSAGGILINQMKELMLHTDLKREDTIFYFTTCGWMMWNWLTCSLSVGASLVLFDGNPFHPNPGALWELAQEIGITVFGTSAGYIGALQNAGVKPGRDYDLSQLKAVLSTGSPLYVENFKYVYEHIKEDLQLASIAGGTDLNGCFALGNPMGPVYAGELQCRGLGMKVAAYDEKGESVIGEQGELVCTAPFPSMPIYFWDDPKGEKYHNAYFDVYSNVWRHGDFIEISERGGVTMYGRSDAVLNPGGVRIGTADIYRIVEQLKEIDDSIVVGQKWKNDVRVILFVKVAEGFKLDDDLKAKIKKTLRAEASPRHAPSKIIAVPDIPYTLNMKKVELAVKKTIHGREVLNKDALRNPEVLEHYAGLKELQED